MVFDTDIHQVYFGLKLCDECGVFLECCVCFFVHGVCAFEVFEFGFESAKGSREVAVFELERFFVVGGVDFGESDVVCEGLNEVLTLCFKFGFLCAK